MFWGLNLIQFAVNVFAFELFYTFVGSSYMLLEQLYVFGLESVFGQQYRVIGPRSMFLGREACFWAKTMHLNLGQQFYER